MKFLSSFTPLQKYIGIEPTLGFNTSFYHQYALKSNLMKIKKYSKIQNSKEESKTLLPSDLYFVTLITSTDILL